MGGLRYQPVNCKRGLHTTATPTTESCQVLNVNVKNTFNKLYDACALVRMYKLLSFYIHRFLLHTSFQQKKKRRKIFVYICIYQNSGQLVKYNAIKCPQTALRMIDVMEIGGTYRHIQWSIPIWYIADAWLCVTQNWVVPTEFSNNHIYSQLQVS